MKSVEVSKMHEDRLKSGFYYCYMSGRGLDIGYKGMGCPEGIEPVLETATGIDLDTPGYDGVHLPFPDESQDYVFASHVLEHIRSEDVATCLREWYRVLKVGGHMVLLLPHCYLYERSFKIPGPWGSCVDHKRTYTPGHLLREIEMCLDPNSYRVISLRDNDKGFDYSIPLHFAQDLWKTCFEIELVLNKIQKPEWDVI